MATQQPSRLAPLGANYNGKFIWVDHDELRRVGATWIRGFIDLHQTDEWNLDRHPNMKGLSAAIDAGFKTIVSLKWDYNELDYPPAGSAEHDAELCRLDRFLPRLVGKVDILVIGNEPFIEAKTPRGMADERLNDFYETLAVKVMDFRRDQGDAGLATRLYMGALNRLDVAARRTPAVERMLRFIASRPELDGADLHPHMSTLADHRAMLDWALPRLRPDQTFVATEFSVIWHWKKHMVDDASPYYCAKYGFAPGTKVHQVIGAAILDPVPYAQWEDFLSHEPWYMARRHFLSNAMKMYRDTGRLAVATYCFCPMRTRKKPLLPKDNPWMMNDVMAPPTVQLRPDGTRHDNFPWADEFRRVQGMKNDE